MAAEEAAVVAAAAPASREHRMSKRPEYTEFEHTADVGIELSAPDERAAYERAAAAMFDLMCDLDRVGDAWTRSVRVEARPGDRQNLLVRWLSELLYLRASENVMLSRFGVTSLADGVLEADIAGERFDPARHTLRAEIKAPTYHQLKIEPSGGEWTVRVIFDT